MTATTRLPVLVGCAVLAHVAIVTGQGDGAATLARMGAYVDAWETELGSVVADEIYRQAVTRLPRSGVVREPGKPAQETRDLVSDFTLIHSRGRLRLDGFRAVKTVDGRAVAEAGPSLNQLLSDARLSWQERWTQVRDRSAAFNLGSIARDINLPTFALAALRTVNQPRFRFTTPRSETVDGEPRQARLSRTGAAHVGVSVRRSRCPAAGQRVARGRGSRVRRTEIRLRDRIGTPADGAAEEQRKRDEELASRIIVMFGPDAECRRVGADRDARALRQQLGRGHHGARHLHRLPAIPHRRPADPSQDRRIGHGRRHHVFGASGV